jgi:hypothetical protein
MKKYLIRLATGLSLLLLWNCSEDTLPFYSGENTVYFAQDSITFSFGLLTVPDTLLRVPVDVAGQIAGHERRFTVTYDSVSGTPGVHFDTLPLEGILPANSSKGYIPVRLLRVPGDKAHYMIRARLVASDEFALKFPRQDLKLVYTSNVTQPAGWVEMFFGYFSPAKYEVVCEVTGRDGAFWLDPISIGLGLALCPLVATHINSKILAGRDHALRDPDNLDPDDKGFMTLRGVVSYYAQYVKIPGDWEPAK